MQRCAVSHHTAPVLTRRFPPRSFTFAWTHTCLWQHTPPPQKAPESLCSPPKAPVTAGTPLVLAQAPLRRSSRVHMELRSQHCLCGLFPSSQRSNPCIVQHCISGGEWSRVHAPPKKGQQVRTAKNSSLKNSLPRLAVLPHRRAPPRTGWGSLGVTGRSQASSWALTGVGGSVTTPGTRAPSTLGLWQSRAGHLTAPERWLTLTVPSYRWGQKHREVE